MSFFAIGLHNVKNPINVGHVLRAAGCFGAALVATSGKRFRRCSTDTANAWRVVPILRADDLRSVIPFDCVPVAVELTDDAVRLDTYRHPARAFYVFGAEDQTLGASVLGWCRDRVMVPTTGCLNLAACANVVMYDRMSKAHRSAP